jgi:tryptophan 2,3-dioxygenase
VPDDPAADPALSYGSYLALDEVLGAQRPRSDEHDELLFIVVHQVYELWFKQLLHELGHLAARLEEGDTPHAVRTLRRILTILKVAVAQVDVIETMSPRQFTSFRDRLDSSSGFQSWQFREIEARLGDLWTSFVAYLDRTGFDASDASDAPEATEELLVRVYADDGGPAQVAEHLVDLDEGLQEWRYRHLKMVERTIGDKAGTGGSSGADYLRSTLFRPVFPALWSVRSRL